MAVHATFYRLPSLETARRWAQAVPEDFLFAAKGSRYLTHLKRLKDAGLGLRRWTAAGRDAFVYFNNDYGGAAVRDALELRELVGRRG